MRKQTDLIALLHNLYHNNEWVEMQEFFECAYALLIYHNARFKSLYAIRLTAHQEICKSFFDANGMPVTWGHDYVSMKDKLDALIDNDEELIRLNKYDECEEAWREEIKAGPQTLEYFESVCHKFITFKNDN